MPMQIFSRPSVHACLWSQSSQCRHLRVGERERKHIHVLSLWRCSAWHDVVAWCRGIVVIRCRVVWTNLVAFLVGGRDDGNVLLHQPVSEWCVVREWVRCAWVVQQTTPRPQYACTKHTIATPLGLATCCAFLQWPPPEDFCIYLGRWGHPGVSMLSTKCRVPRKIWLWRHHPLSGGCVCCCARRPSDHIGWPTVSQIPRGRWACAWAAMLLRACVRAFVVRVCEWERWWNKPLKLLTPMARVTPEARAFSRPLYALTVSSYESHGQCSKMRSTFPSMAISFATSDAIDPLNSGCSGVHQCEKDAGQQGTLVVWMDASRGG